MSHNYLKEVQFLIVDDQSFTRLLVRRILGVLGGRRISEAKDVDTAWQRIISDSRPDLLIVDWEMRGSDGLELVRLVRHDDASPDKYLPIIMLTAHSEKSRIMTARDAGVNEFVTKPISPKTLFDRISRVIEYPRRFIRTKDFFGPDRRRHKILFRGKDRRKAVEEPDESHEDEDTE